MQQLGFNDVDIFKRKIRSIKENVLELLKENEAARENYRDLVWDYWEKYDIGHPTGHLAKSLFLGGFLTHPLTIIRCGTKVREEYPELAPKKDTQEAEQAYREEMA